MSQRNSGYERLENDLYPTPFWATMALLPHLGSRSLRIWEPCAGKGNITVVLQDYHYMTSTDKHTYDGSFCPVHRGLDFLDDASDLAADDLSAKPFNAIVTNPPFDNVEAFLKRALELTKPRKGLVAMLLKIDFDSGDSRHHLFRDNPAWDCKVVLTKRITWVHTPGKDSKPSQNNAWFIWNWAREEGPPKIVYSDGRYFNNERLAAAE